MIENRPLADRSSRTSCCSWAWPCVALPLYVTFVASTLTAEQVLRVADAADPGRPGGRELLAGAVAAARSALSAAPVGRMMLNSLVSALVIAIGKIIISLLSAFAIVYFRFRLRGCSSSG